MAELTQPWGTPTFVMIADDNGFIQFDSMNSISKE